VQAGILAVSRGQTVSAYSLGLRPGPTLRLIIIPQALRERHWQGYHATMRTGKSRYGEGHLLSVPAIRKDGTRLSVEFTILSLRDAGGRMEGIAAVMRDATKRFEQIRALQKELAALKAAAGGG